MAKNAIKPLHQGGRTLAAAGRKPGRSEHSHGRRKVWIEGGGEYTRGKIRLEGETPSPDSRPTKR